mmetsp:Transcript_6808/g.14167  ORF Transcript_6808/g.14167 Transcript_6808/m.14167 type:complete len:141 (+) Transcript_6808:126-548(+)
MTATMSTDSSEDLSNSSGDHKEDGNVTDRPLHELDPSLALKLLSLRRDDDDPSEPDGDTEFSDGASILASKLLQHFVSCRARLAAIEVSSCPLNQLRGKGSVYLLLCGRFQHRLEVINSYEQAYKKCFEIFPFSRVNSSR